MMLEWQENWEKGVTGRSTFNILIKVSLQISYWKIEDTLFFTSHAPFPSNIRRFNLAPTAYCPCGNLDATPLHDATEFLLTSSFHVTKPIPELEPVWFISVATCRGSRLKIQKMVSHFEENQDLLRINNHTFQ
ncbi:hypothetical protein AVEN_179701-1 [Araneus ventricosus]|uniref:Uncharacterized protein n=1 Tax=Araneus ventricosus TaxID=182803 RepID=A0A4Y2LV98_ARAVE|nr:hypothetical protein AVEN_179701-1 [Araneus ventricosus]